MATDQTLLLTLSACRKAATTMLPIAAAWKSARQAVSSPACDSKGSRSDLPGLSQHKRTNETPIASIRAGRSHSLGSASPPLCTASRRLAATPLRVSRRRH